MTDPLIIGLIFMVIFFVLLGIGTPVGVCMALVGFAGFIFVISMDGAISKIEIVPFQTLNSYDLAVIPLFILMAEVCFAAGFTINLYDAAYKWLGRLPGGLAVASIAACAVFAAISSSSMATAITLGLVALPEMRKQGYDDSLATGSIAAGGTLGAMIPPSNGFILYGIMTENSIGKLFMAGVLPGITQAVLYMVAILIECRAFPRLGPQGPTTTWTEKMAPLAKTGEILVLIVLVLGGLFIGWFTPTEAASVGAFGAITVAFIRRRLTWQKFKNALLGTARTTGMVYFLLVGAFLMNYFLAASGIPAWLAESISAMQVSPTVILIFIIIVWIILGCLIDAMAMLLLTVPIFYPMMMNLGFDPIWFGVIAVLMMEVGVITPPVGMNVFAIAGITKVPMSTIYKGIIPFFFADIVLVAILILTPKLALFLPSLMR